MNRFFFDNVDPRISVEDGRLVVDLPGENYLGDPHAFWEGFKSYEDGQPGWPVSPESYGEEHCWSYVHGYITARMAELLGAEYPEHTTAYGSATLRRILIEEEGAADRGRSDAGPPHSPEQLCPYEEGERRTAWIAGYRGDQVEDVPADAHEEGVKAWESLHDTRDEHLVRAEG
jgi:ribosome modulation factor